MWLVAIELDVTGLEIYFVSIRNMKVSSQVCVYTLLPAKLLQLCLTLCDPMYIACQAPLSMGFSR